MTLDRIVRRNARRFPDKPAVYFGTNCLTWADFDQRIDRLTRVFQDAGLSSGERVAALLDNRPEYLEVYFACARAHLILAPLNYRLTRTELQPLIDQTEPAAYIFSENYANSLTPFFTRDDKLSLQIDGSAATYEDLLAEANEPPMTLDADPDQPLAIFFTSGTTGQPKGALVSHRNLIANGYNQIIADRSRGDDVNLIATPLYHMGAVFMAVTYMMLGCTQVVLPAFKPDQWLAVAARRRVTVSLLIPTMINSVLNDAQASTIPLPSLRLIFYGGGPMPPAVLTRAMDRFGCGFTQGYGLTETLEATFLTAEDHRVQGDPAAERRLASAGREAVGADVRIVDDDGREVAMGTIGEIVVRSESVIQGYWRQASATAEAIKDGWFYTGDLGYFDEGRYLFVVDRKKDMIISGGVNIYSKEIEERLYQHPAVLEAAVIGLPDSHWGEAVTAVVVRRPDRQLSADEIVTHCRETLAGFKQPRRVEFVDALPKNPSGKILKRDLRLRYTDEAS